MVVTLDFKVPLTTYLFANLGPLLQATQRFTMPFMGANAQVTNITSNVKDRIRSQPKVIPWLWCPNFTKPLLTQPSDTNTRRTEHTLFRRLGESASHQYLPCRARLSTSGTELRLLTRTTRSSRWSHDRFQRRKL